MSKILSTPAGIAEEFQAHASHIKSRKRRGKVWFTVLYVSVFLAIISLASLLLNIFDGAFGLVAYTTLNDPKVLEINGKPVEVQNKDELITSLKKQVELNDLDGTGLINANRLATMVTNELDLKLSPDQIKQFDDAIGDDLKTLSYAQLQNVSESKLREVVQSELVGYKIIKSWNLFESLFNRKEIETQLPEIEQKENEETGQSLKLNLSFRSWLNPELLSGTMSSDSDKTGIRSALLGSFFVVLLAIVIALPIGVAAAVYLEEFADKRSKLVSFIQLNIYNLAGVPSIIYGVLGLLVFVRIFADFTHGRTLMSGALTLSLLVLPVIIINTQEALRAVPRLLRDSAFGVGATRLQVVWYHVLPSCIDRILTGTIIAVSRALGETAPLIVVGAATFIQVDPNGLFSGFTVLPMQIYQNISKPGDEFKHVAAAAIIVLLLLLIGLNLIAILIRNRISKKRSLV